VSKLQPITNEQIEAIENEVAMSASGWDMVNPKELVAAVLKVMSKAQPISTAPSNRNVLAQHKVYGWVEAYFDPDVYAQSIQQWGAETGGFGWSCPAFDDWLYHRSMLAWAELPEVAP